MFENYILTSTAGGPCRVLSQYETRDHEYVYSHLHNQNNTREIHHKSKIVNNDNENKEYVNQKAHGRPQYQLRPTRFLIAESEKELQSLFKTYLDLIGANSVIVDNSDKVMSTLYQSDKKGNNYDAVILDTHLEGKGSLEVAKKIHENDHSQRIILITTSLKEQLPKDKLESAEIDNEDILVMPFELSTLGKLLNQ